MIATSSTGLAERTWCARAAEPAAPDSDQDTRLLARLRAGDRQAAEALARAYGGRMLAVARRLLHCEADSADAVQEAFLAALRAIDSFAGNARLWTWLYRITTNTCLMKRRVRARRSGVSLDDLPPGFDVSGQPAHPGRPRADHAFDRLARDETQAQVRACIDRLPDPYRAILVLRDLEERDTEETARLLGISRGAVKTRLHRARQGLRALLEPLFGEDGTSGAW
jgi:RNA polymerase sigma-70 factor (ECF subfamily)